MRIWVSKSSEVPLQEQLSTQFILGIVSADLKPGERLPSTNELARRFHIHANTVRAAYRGLVDRGWVEWRRGSGFYVRTFNSGNSRPDAHTDLDRLIAGFLEIARAQGYSSSEVQSRMTRWFSLQPPDHILVIEPDSELRQILIAELKDHTSMRIVGAGIDGCSEQGKLAGALCVALYDHAEQVRAALPAEASCLLLHSRSIARSLAVEQKPPPDLPITILSRWPDFLNWARTTLVAVGIDPAALDLRDAREKGWERGLNERSFIVTDSLLARRLPSRCRARVFRIIADESLAELKKKGTYIYWKF